MLAYAIPLPACLLFVNLSLSLSSKNKLVTKNLMLDFKNYSFEQIHLDLVILTNAMHSYVWAEKSSWRKIPTCFSFQMENFFHFP